MSSVAHVSFRGSRMSRGLGLALVVSMAAGQAFAGTLRVPSQFATIQSAIDAAVAGDEVLVAPGVYVEAIHLRGKAIVVQSEAGPDSTVIDGGGLARYVVTINSGETSQTVVRGFTVRGGLGVTGGSGPTGGGVRIVSSSPRLENLVITGNSGVFGGGVSIVGGAPALLDLTVANNNANSGGGIYAEMASTRIEGLVATGNRAINNGGAVAITGGSVTMTGADLEANTAGSFGGAMFLNHTNAQISIVDAKNNGEMTVDAYGTQTFHTFGGGGVYATSTTGRIERATFTDNKAAAGAGVYVASGNGLTIVNTVVARNIAGIGGAGVWANSASPTIINCTIVHNRPGGIYTTYNSFPIVRNTVLSKNVFGAITGVEIYGNGNTSISDSVVRGPILAGATVGPRVIDADPRLDASFTPLAGSPLIDAGNNGFVPADVRTDLRGKRRFVDDPATPDTGTGTSPIVDIGAVEFVPPLAPRTSTHSRPQPL
ncbi:MAG: hypothetical protein KF838_00940 [Phycisphaeraceae bacterium]|nr:MAG: hypothetical protein KF838_00940 [Phycisphaeraceae bacterium]